MLQGSCLGPILFTLYSSKFFEFAKTHLPEVHCYADDTQAHISVSPKLKSALKSMENCLSDIRLWMLNDNLKWSDDKTEFRITGTSQQLEKVNITSFHVGNSDIHPVPTARNLGSWFDCRLSMSKHVIEICSSSFFYLYNIRHIRNYLSQRQPRHSFMHSYPVVLTTATAYYTACLVLTN